MLPDKLLKIFANKRDQNIVPAPSMDRAMRRNAIDLFRDDILSVQELIQQDLSHWLNVD